MRPVLELGLQTFRPYAERHGYDLVVRHGHSDGRPRAWSKVLLVRRLLDAYDEVLWLFADTMILDGQRDIGDELAPEITRVSPGTRAARCPNTGV